MNTQIYHFSVKKENHPKLFNIYSRRISKGAVVNEPPVFESLKVYCIMCLTGLLQFSLCIFYFQIVNVFFRLFVVLCGQSGNLYKYKTSFRPVLHISLLIMNRPS